MLNSFLGHGSKTLGEVLTRGSNNLDLARLLAATAVIYGHSFGLHGKESPFNDVVYQTTGIFAAEWGVKTFFFLSGLLVVNSVLSDGNALHYGIKRLFRIWPALIFVTLISVFVIGPALTTHTTTEYFDDSETWAFLRRMVEFRIWGNHTMGLPGVFEANPIPMSMNVPLWTLSVEAYAYVLIFALFLVGAFRKESAAMVFGLFLVDSLLPQKFLFFWLDNSTPDFGPIPFCFALGGLLAVFKDQIKINLPVLVGVVLLSDLLEGGVHERYLTYTTMFLLVLYVSAMPVVVNLPRLPDISYGTYLWGWPVQQLVIYFFPEISFYQNLIVTIVLAYGMAAVSWYLVERRFMQLGQALIKRNKARLAGDDART